MSFRAQLHVVGEDARRAERLAAERPSTLRADGAGPFDVQILDLSMHGFRCLTLSHVGPGDLVSIGLRGEASGSAVVRWRRSDEVGCEFLTPLSVDQLTAILAHQVEAARPVVEAKPEPLMHVAGISAGQLLLVLVSLSLVLALLQDLLARPF